jgi:transposase
MLRIELIITSVPRRRRWTAIEKRVRMVEETFEPGTTVSLPRPSSSHGAGWWLRVALTPAGSGEEVVPASDYRALQTRVRELQRLLGKKTPRPQGAASRAPLRHRDVFSVVHR